MNQSNYDILLANINKNVLLDQIGMYKSLLKPSSFLLLSGFYRSDVDDIVKAAAKVGFQPINEVEKENWMAMTFQLA